MRWNVSQIDPKLEAHLARELGVAPMVARVLAVRGFTDPDEAHDFLWPQLDDLGDPHLLPDFAVASEILCGARTNQELVFVHGDYDVDGITSAAIFERFLRVMGWKTHTHVPHRLEEGYGINVTAVARAAELGAKVFLTCDCGISAIEQVELAKAHGMKVIVTDHHALGPELPRADAVVNPHRPDSEYPFTELSGAGIVFRFCEGLAQDLGMPVKNYRDHFLDLATVGTVADVMPLVGENRIIVRHGLESLRNTSKLGLRALMETAGVKVDRPLTTSTIGYALGPRINAVGRMDDAGVALRLLLTKDKGEALDLANTLEVVNQARRDRQVVIQAEAEQMVQEQGLSNGSVIVLVHDGWEPGLVGLVAGRLVERYFRPAFVLRVDPESGHARGSARSIPAFNLAEAIYAHPHLMSGGGHAGAAGCSFDIAKLEAVRAALEAYAAQTLTPEDLVPAVDVDADFQLGELTIEALTDLECLAPFGLANPLPLVRFRDVRVAHASRTRTGEHLRLQLQDETTGDASSVTAMGWRMGEREDEARHSRYLDVIGRVEINEYNGRLSPQITLVDFRPAS